MGSKGCGEIDFTPCNHHPETCTCRDYEPNSAIIKAAKLTIKKTYIPKSLKGKIKIIVNNDGIKVIKLKKKKNG